MGTPKDGNAREMTIPNARRLILSAGLLSLLWFCGDLATRPSVSWPQNLPQVGQKPAPTVGAPAIGFELKTLEGKPVGLDSFAANP